MRVSAVLVVVCGTVFMSGCAGPRYAQEVNRLKSDVGLLDQRVSQLERISLGQPSATVPLDSQMQPTPAAPLTSTRGTPSTTGAIKPSTKEIQQALKHAGFYQGAIDGKLGPQTREAIREFQRVHGLKDDGIVGKQTWAKLGSYGDLSAGSGELNAAEVLK